MKVFPIVCHKCRTKYNLKAEHPEVLLDKEFRCKKCGFTLPFVSMVPELQQYMRGQAAPQQENLHTVIPGQPSGPNMSPMGPQPMGPQPLDTGMALQVAGSPNFIPLPPGKNILGRDSSDSRANIKLARDPYMSRTAAELYVTVMNGASCAEFVPLPSANKVYINDRYVEPGTMVRLYHGDNILLGMTKIIFHAR